MGLHLYVSICFQLKIKALLNHLKQGSFTLSFHLFVFLKLFKQREALLNESCIQLNRNTGYPN